MKQRTLFSKLLFRCLWYPKEVFHMNLDLKNPSLIFLDTHQMEK